ncbi:isocitrate lyase/phosphoenolpyruvate mutase family protein [Nocardia sp. NPDC004068]|uniref:isocitrate lyase/PEP mutase family protein n=1 Tax=Nocardia sp. NPDC004068 TaxID=3364303 RepID=UPI0036AF6306
MSISERFRELHQPGRPLILPNAWDYCSAAALVAEGFPAIGTTSLGVSAAAGVPDAAGATRAETIDLARKLARLPVPITVDIEAGFGDAPEVAHELAEAGIAGVNVEDGRGSELADPNTQAELIAAIKSRTPPLFVNARVDTHWLGLHHDSTIDRMRRYEKAGADGLFVPGVRDPAEIARLVKTTALPLNVLYLPGGPSVRELAAQGVARISTGGLLFRAAVAATVDTARAIRDNLPTPPNIPTYARIQNLVN